MDAPRPRVLLAGHWDGGGAALRAKLEHGGFAVCAEAEDIAGAVAAAVRERPEVCLVDGAIAGGPHAIAIAIQRAAPLVAVVFLAGSATDAELLDAVTVGARGHLRDDLDGQQLVAALADVVAGRPAFPRRLEALLVAAVQHRV